METLVSCYNSQAVIKILENYHISSELVWNCHQSFMKLAECNRFQMLWVPDHTGIEGYKNGDQLAKIGSECPFLGPELACGMAVGVVRKEGDHGKHWETTIGLKHMKGFLKGLMQKRTRELVTIK
jgi:hypothetical protein